jgi:hypothetical protein
VAGKIYDGQEIKPSADPAWFSHWVQRIRVFRLEPAVAWQGCGLRTEAFRAGSAINNALLVYLNTRPLDFKQSAQARMRLILTMIKYTQKQYGQAALAVDPTRVEKGARDMAFLHALINSLGQPKVALAYLPDWAPAKDRAILPRDFKVPLGLFARSGALGALADMLEKFGYEIDRKIQERFDRKLKRLFGSNA